MEKPKITLGADPEFELVHRGWIASAERLLEGEIGLPWGFVGTDGHLLELRPKPSANPETLIGNLGRLLLSVLGVAQGVPSTACKRHPIGGHVHIGGVPGEVREDLVSVIDGLLGDLFHSLSGETRLKAGYGKRKDWRPQPWGVEYRTPPASVWSHPAVALVFLRAIKWVAERFLAGEDLFEDPAWPAIRASAERAAEFVRRHEGRLHWGAWKAYVGTFGKP
jgi:hypothetical protein